MLLVCSTHTVPYSRENGENKRKREAQKMIERLLKLAENDGFTLRRGKEVNYKTGFQVATEGKETRDARTAARMIEEYGGDCGVWYSAGIYYVDKSHREKTRRAALECGRAHAQQSILKWADKSLIWC